MGEGLPVARQGQPLQLKNRVKKIETHDRDQKAQGDDVDAVLESALVEQMREVRPDARGVRREYGGSLSIRILSGCVGSTAQSGCWSGLPLLACA